MSRCSPHMESISLVCTGMAFGRIYPTVAIMLCGEISLAIGGYPANCLLDPHRSPPSISGGGTPRETDKLVAK